MTDGGRNSSGDSDAVQDGRKDLGLDRSKAFLVHGHGGYSILHGRNIDRTMENSNVIDCEFGRLEARGEGVRLGFHNNEIL
jgi:hypothetical protein